MLPSEAGPVDGDAPGVVQTDTLNLRVESLPQQPIDATLSPLVDGPATFTATTDWQITPAGPLAETSEFLVSSSNRLTASSPVDAGPSALDAGAVDTTPQAALSGEVSSVAAKDWAALIQKAMFPTHSFKQATIRTAYSVDPSANFEAGRLSSSYRNPGSGTLGPSNFIVTGGLYDGGGDDSFSIIFDAAPVPLDVPMTVMPDADGGPLDMSPSQALQGGAADPILSGSPSANDGMGTGLTELTGNAGESATGPDANAPAGLVEQGFSDQGLPDQGYADQGFTEDGLAAPTTFSSANERMLRNYAIAPISLETQNPPQLSVADAMPSVTDRSLDVQYAVATAPTTENVHTFQAAVVPISSLGFQSMVEPAASVAQAQVAQRQAAVDLQFANLDSDSEVLGDLVSDLLAPGDEFPAGGEEPRPEGEQPVDQESLPEAVDENLKVGDSWTSGLRLENLIATLGGALGGVALNRRLTPDDEA